MTLLITGLILFFGIHSVSIVAPAWRDQQVALRGEAMWKGLYSLVALVGLILIVVGYGQARLQPMPLYQPSNYLRHVAWLLMLPVFPLLLAAYVPDRIQHAAKHPMLLATKFWALAHLLTNGNVADVLLFGSFLLWAVADRVSLKYRPGRSVPGAPAGRFNDLLVIVLGMILYAAFVGGLHLWLMGVSPR
jgi:uncharacterized membrane protein